MIQINANIRRDRGFVGMMALRLFLLFLVVSQVAFLGTRYRLRCDLTGDRLYTLTQSTTKVLHKLTDPLLIEAYFSPDDKLPPTARPLRAAMRHVLDEYVKLGEGRVIRRYLDPTSDMQLREKALRLGIQPQRMMQRTGRAAANDTVIGEVWQGLRLRYADKKQEILPLLPFQANTFAYEAMLTPRIRALTVAAKPKIGFLAYPMVPGTPYFGERPGKRRYYNLLLRYFGEEYDFRPLALRQGQLIPQDLKAVILVRPKGLTDRAKYVLDQYLVGGGKLVIFADTHECEIRDDIQNQIRIEPVSYDAKGARLKFLDQLAHYGAKVEDRVVSEGVKEAWQFYATFVQDPRTMQTGLEPIDYPYLFEALDVDWRQHADMFAPRNQNGEVDEAQAQNLKKILKPGVAKDHPLMAQILKVGIPGFFWPCPVGLTDRLPENVKGQVLLNTSPQGWDETPPEEIDPFNRYQDYQGREAEYKKWQQKLVTARQVTPPKQIGLMVHLEGKFSSFFAGRKIPPRPVEHTEDEEPDPLEWDTKKHKKDEKKPEIVGPVPADKEPSGAAPENDPPMVTKATKAGSLLVIGDADFIRDDFLSPAYSRPAPKATPPVVIGPMSKDWQQPQRAARFFLNILSWLAEEEDLLELRNKAPTDRTLLFARHDATGGENVRDFQERVESVTAWIRWTNILLPCLILVAVGLFVVIRRRAQKVAFLASLEA
jgi:ABC-type uncharacterized transport system involved in gliding motility auxiliary subunit